MTRYANPGSSDSNIEVKDTYGHWINNEWRDPIKGEYFDNPTPVTGEAFTRVARGTAEDIDAVPGRGAGFSLEAPEGMRFLTRSRLFTQEEKDALGL